MKELSAIEKAKLYDKVIERGNSLLSCNELGNAWVYKLLPELKESEGEKLRKEMLQIAKESEDSFYLVLTPNKRETLITLLENQGQQGQQKEINLDKILKHYPRETELYSPLYGKLWLAEVDEDFGIITCYKHPLDEGCTRAILKQEDTVSFYANGTTGLPDFSVSDECILFLYDSEKQGKQKLSDEQKRICREVYADILSAKGFDLATINSELKRLEEQLDNTVNNHKI